MIGRDEDIAKAVRQRDAAQLINLFFEKGRPEIRAGFKTESELWDYKVDVPHLGREDANAWAHVACDVLALHNHRGGILFFGFTNDFRFRGATVRLDSKLLNDQLRKFLPDTIWVDFYREYIQADQRYLGVAIVQPKSGAIVRFQESAPEVNGKRLFEKGLAALRDNDSTRVLEPAEIEALNRQSIRLVGENKYYIDEPFFRVPSPDYVEFVYRNEICNAVEKALSDRRTSVAHIIGIGGVGKTALATWAAIKKYEEGAFSFIVSQTAKDRELTSAGISALKPEFTSFESLLNSIAEVLQYPEYKTLALDEKAVKVRELLTNSGGLLYVDNLETVDDSRIITFLDNLPEGVRALVTSRRLTVRVAVYPIPVGPLDNKETCAFVRSLQVLPALAYVSGMKDAEITRVGESCNRIPLAIRWVLSRSDSVARALREADALANSGRQGEELLEFSFRRVFERMSDEERCVLEVLSLFTQAQPTEVLLVGSNLKLPQLQDALSALIDDAIVHRRFDSDRNDEAYALLPITRNFVYSQVTQSDGREAAIRQRLSDYFEGRDIQNPEERIIIREVRQGTTSSDTALIDLAISAKKRGDLDGAQDLLRQAVNRNPKGWRAYRELGELSRHELRNTGDALRFYEQASANAPASRSRPSKNLS